MKIITNGTKDYYDYLVGIKGIDEYIVFDRRNCTILNHNHIQTKYFSLEKIYNDKHRHTEKRWVKLENGKEKFQNTLCGEEMQFCLEVGDTHYFFNVERYLDENDNLVLKHNLICKKEGIKKKSKSIIAFLPCECRRIHFFMKKSKDVYTRFHNECIDNPILIKTFIPSYISPEEIYDIIYNYIMSTKEIKIEDKRNDIEKIESHGFDKKSSFRNVK